MSIKTKRLIDENQIIMIDTCFAMSEGFADFVAEIEEDLLIYNRKIVVKSIVMAELYRHMGSNDELLRAKATRAVDIICMRRNIFEIDDKHITAEAILKGFADVEFLTEFTKSRIKYKMALLTNDYKLGKDINELNNLESCYGKKVAVFCLNRSGKLEERLYEMETPTLAEDIVSDSVFIKKEENKNLVPMIISSATFFIAGIVADKYGKNITNKIIKAIA